MNWNGQRETLNHLIRLRNDPANAAQYQKDFDSQRWRRIQDALTTRPVFTALNYTLPLAGQTPPVKAYTPQLGYDVIYTGFKTDIWPARDIELQFTESEQGLVKVGDQTNLYLRSDDIAGCSVDAGGGQVGTFYLPQPIMVPARQRLSVGVYKTDATAADVNANIVLIGVRVYNLGFAQAIFDDQQKAVCQQVMQLRPYPVTRIIKIATAYATGAVGETDTNLLSPRLDEPVIIRGIRSTWRRSMIDIGIMGESPWTTVAGQTPIWGVAGENELGSDNYQWFSRGIYVPSNGVIEVSKLTSSIDGSTIEDSASGQITFYCETV